MGMRFDGVNLYFRGKQVSLADAQLFLCEHYPNLLTDYIVKREVKKERVILHIDWQGVLGSKLFQILIFTNETKDNFPTAD